MVMGLTSILVTYRSGVHTVMAGEEVALPRRPASTAKRDVPSWTPGLVGSASWRNCCPDRVWIPAG